jgi:hypothetical protein
MIPRHGRPSTMGCGSREVGMGSWLLRRRRVLQLHGQGCLRLGINRSSRTKTAREVPGCDRWSWNDLWALLQTVSGQDVQTAMAPIPRLSSRARPSHRCASLVQAGRNEAPAGQDRPLETAVLPSRTPPRCQEEGLSPMYRRVLGPVPLDSPSPEEAYEPTLGANERAASPGARSIHLRSGAKTPKPRGKIPFAPGIQTPQTAYRHSFYPGMSRTRRPLRPSRESAPIGRRKGVVR